jgi:NAD(P)H-dependent FMN reductase
MHRYTSATLWNTKATKRAQMIRPDQLFKLPQDVYMDNKKPKSTPEQLKAFLDQVEAAKAAKN